ncbi:MAG: class I SAM-dependent RNA methyltransferase [Sandaracinaceae bacterium]
MAGAFLGERVRARPLARPRADRDAPAALEAVLSPHLARRPSPCPHAGSVPGRCGGCPLIALDEAAQRAQLMDMLQGLGLHVADVVASPAAFHYRRSAKRVAFAEADGALALGSWSPGTHVGASMRGCPVDHPRIARAFDELEERARERGMAPYDEASGRGELRYAWAKLDTDHLTLTLITADGDPRALAEALTEPDAVAHSVQPGRTNAIRGGAPTLLRGARRGDPLGFLQPNPDLIALAVDELLREPDGAWLSGEHAWDLYAGAGAITRRLRERFARVEACEAYAGSASELGIEASRAEDFVTARAELAPPDVVIANPPRKGMGEAVCDAIARVRPPRLHIMACGPRGLADDRRWLLARGYREVGLTAYQSLPQTAHVELVLKLEAGTKGTAASPGPTPHL